VGVTLSKRADSTSITEASFHLEADGANVPGTITYSSTTATARITVTGGLQPATEYTLVLDGVTSLWGEQLSDSWTFETAVVPEPADDVYTMRNDTILSVGAPGVRANDDDNGLTAVTAVVVDGPDGVLALGSDGSFTYRPPTGFKGTDTFTYRLSSENGYSDAATVTITVAGLVVTPLAGTNRYATAVEVSEEAFPTGAANVVLATGENWPDALGGAALAGALDGPILLTKKASLPGEIRSEIVRLKATKVYILGSTDAVSGVVASAVDGIPGVSVERIWGPNRYDTARAVAERAIALQGASFDGTAFIATGMNFPDALGASPLSAAKGWPIYLSNPARGDNATLISQMDAQGVTRALVLGGTNVVDSSIETKARSVLGSATRLKGDNRYQTALAVATFGVNSAGLGWNKLAIATGTNFPDALAGGVLQGRDGSVMLLTPGTVLNGDVRTTLAANKATIFEIRYLGSTDAVNAAVRTAVQQALK
jgi:putative cell wall-binding protein